MLTRFCLYGFLKNQRYHEPVFILALLDKGLAFGLIGILFGFKELIVAVLEIPSGAVADVLGRRGSMILSICAYIASFAIFALAEPAWMLFLAMALYAIGDAFRSGTHKAMIFRWLELQGRTGERTRIYGVTRSWSKYGSALAVILTGTLLATTSDYSLIFAITIVPYVLLLVNLLGYPAELEANREHGAVSGRSMRRVLRHMRQTLAISFRRPGLRRLLVNSMGFDGFFHAVKDYLQPVLAAIAISLIAGSALNNEQAIATVLTPVYVVLFLLTGLASRWAYRFAAWSGGETKGGRRLWLAFGLCFALMLAAPSPIMIALAFVALHVIQNLWRPMLIARYDDEGEESHGATILSVEGQTRRVATMILAPVVGYAVQLASEGERVSVWPIGAIGLGIAVVAIVSVRLAGGRSIREW